MKQGNYILWLPSWYPNRLQPFNGDFIQRHARAVAKFHSIEVIHLVRDEFGLITRDVFIEQRENKNLRETIVYYYIKPNYLKTAERIKSLNRFIKVFREIFSRLIDQKGLPLFAHVHIAMKAGIFAIWIKRKYNIPFLITEQWVVYLPESVPGFNEQPFYFRVLFKMVFKATSGVSTVSKTLGEKISNRFDIPQPKLIPNVVDGDQFLLAKKISRRKVRFIHISTMDYQKDPETMIEAFILFKLKYDFPFRLNIVGNPTEQIRDKVKNAGLENEIDFHAEMPHESLVSFIQGADCLLLCSRYETFGCVIIEANSCGVPVIVTDIPVFHENVTPYFNGLFVKPQNPEHFAFTISEFCRQKERFDAVAIRNKTIGKFSFEKIGSQFSDWYAQIFPQLINNFSVKI